MLRSKYQNQTPVQLDSENQTPANPPVDCRNRALQSFLRTSAEYLDLDGADEGHRD